MSAKAKDRRPGGELFPARHEFRAGLRQSPAGNEEDLLDPAVLSDAERRELLAGVQSGSVLSIRTYVTVFDEAGENNHHMGLVPGELEKLAKGASGVPFMKDHSASTDKVVGMVVEGRVSGGELGLVVELLDPVFMERFARGLVKQFSVGLAFDGVTCSVCDEKYEEEDFFGMLYLKAGCKHKPGKKYDSKVCKKLASGARLVECSAVYSGAYKANRIGHSTGSVMDTEEMLHELEELRAKQKDDAGKLAQLEAESAQKDAKIAEADAEVDRLKLQEFGLLLNRGIADGKINARHRPLFEKAFAASKDKGFLEEYLSLAESPADPRRAAFVGDVGGDVLGNEKNELGLAELYKEKK